MRKAASCHSIRALKKFFQRCTRKRFPPLKYLRDLKEEEFKSLHYTHRGAVVKPSDEGFQENFLIYATESYHGRQQYHFRKKARLGEWIIRNRELHYREEMEANDILEGQVDPNKPQQKYAEVTAKLFQRQRDLADFLLEPSTEEEYNNYMGHYLKQDDDEALLKFERVSLKDVGSEESTDKQELEVIELRAKKMQSAYDVEPTQFLEIEADGNCLYRFLLLHFGQQL
uniref:OTU domain-containing protein n=1 Tax=Ditylenchus dipsaci TaxID=166011 RepID=A0A915D206_9BILA